MRFKSKVGTLAALVSLVTSQTVAIDPVCASGNYTVAGHHSLPTVPTIPMDNVRTFGATGDGVTRMSKCQRSG